MLMRPEENVLLPAMKLSEHLSSEELVCRCGKCELSDPAVVARHVHPQLVEKFEELRLALKVPIRINRGVSCWDHHVAIYKQQYLTTWDLHVTRDSRHLVRGEFFSAIDWYPSGSAELFYAAMTAAYFRFSAIILYRNFIHADVGQRNNVVFI